MLDNGISKIAKTLSKDDLVHQWQQMKSKLDSVLLITNQYSSDEIRKLCAKINDLDSNERKQHILDYWGKTCLDKCEPILKQLEILESKM